MRLEYHNDMAISRQLDESAEMVERGPRARTRKLMLETATRLMQAGATPSVSDVAEASGVSRATAYRYFPSQAVLVKAVVDEALGPILSWSSDLDDVQARVSDLMATAMPRIDDFEATFKAALKLALEQWAQRQAGTLGAEPQFVRGHRVELLLDAVSPLEGKLSKSERDRLAQALSLVFGVEVLVILKDIWGLDAEKSESVAQWAAAALVRAAIEDADNDRH